MLDRLVNEGYVRRAGRVVELTPKGEALANKVVRKHRLAERLLVDVIGLEWHKVHKEAGAGSTSSPTTSKSDLVSCWGPHHLPAREPDPGVRLGTFSTEQMPLADAAPGSTVRLERISEQVELDIERPRLPRRAWVHPGRHRRRDIPWPDGTLLLELAASTVAFGPDLSSHLYVVAA